VLFGSSLALVWSLFASSLGNLSSDRCLGGPETYVGTEEPELVEYYYEDETPG
jgi:hypothetical protein